MNTSQCFNSKVTVGYAGKTSKLSKCLIALGLIAGVNMAGAAEVIPGPGDQCLVGAEPLLSVADFNGDGIVDNTDLLMIGDVLKQGKYVAFFDRNADGRVNLTDLDLVNQDLGRSSNVLDQEIAEVFLNTEKYRALGKGALAGFVPATQNAPGHGVHWLQPITFAQSAYPNEPVRADPSGLNYSTDGVLQAVYWGQPVPVDSGGNIISDPPTDFFSEQYSSQPIHWHEHPLGCFVNLGFIDYANFGQGIAPEQCKQIEGISDGIPVSFYMLHLWLYYLNPNGAFAMTHPCAGKSLPMAN